MTFSGVTPNSIEVLTIGKDELGGKPRFAVGVMR
jgi:hypothetical protein